MNLKQSTKNNFADQIRALSLGQFAEEHPLYQYTSIRVGGNARYWFEPIDENALSEALALAKESAVRVYLLGGGSNVLIPDDGLDGLVMRLSSPHFCNIQLLNNGQIRCGAGTPLGLLIKFLVQHGFGDCSFMMGIPARVGGAIAMNAGTGKTWIDAFVVQARVLTPEGKFKDITRDQMGFGYRSAKLGNHIITHVDFAFPKRDPNETQKDIDEYNRYRQETQDIRFPNSGCMFANPDNDSRSAGALIDQCGLKGFRVGDAQVSKSHANFVVNCGKAKASDVVALIEQVETKVLEACGIQLKREIKIW